MLTIWVNEFANAVQLCIEWHSIVQVQHFLMLSFAQGVLHNLDHLCLCEVVRFVQVLPRLSGQVFHVIRNLESVVHVRRWLVIRRIQLIPIFHSDVPVWIYAVLRLIPITQQ